LPTVLLGYPFAWIAMLRPGLRNELGWTEIPANVVTLDGLHVELAQIDENLIRDDLSVLERSEQIRRRKEIMCAR
jgi:hypothetical protein